MSDKTFWVRSMFGFNSQEPIVSFSMPGGETVQMSPADARDLAMNLLRSAEAADTDAFVIGWAKAKIPGIDDRGAAILLNDFRQMRDAREEQG